MAPRVLIEAWPKPMGNEPQFARSTVLVACDVIASHPAMYTHAAFDAFILELGAESAVPTGKNQGYIAEKAHRLKEHLIAHPSARTQDGEFMVDAVVRKAASLATTVNRLYCVRLLQEQHVARRVANFRFPPKADKYQRISVSPLCATSRHLQWQQIPHWQRSSLRTKRKLSRRL
jgi:hypothetical protein